MPQCDTGERVTPVLDFPSRDGLSVQAIRVDYEPGGFTSGTHRHPAGAYVYVTDGSVMPANPGVNPSLTITALAERAMILAAEQLHRKLDVDATPPRPLRDAAM